MNTLDWPVPSVGNRYARTMSDSRYPHLWEKLAVYYMPSAIPFGSAGQSILDLSGNRRNGTVNTGVAINPTGRVGTSISLPGSGSGNAGCIATGASLGAIDANMVNEKTYMFWTKPNSAQASPSVSGTYDGAVIIGDGDGTSGGYGWVCKATAGGLDRIWFGNWVGSETRVGSTYTNDQWAHFACVHYAGSIYIYKNGVLQANTTSAATSNSSIGLRWGNNYNNARRFQGLIDDMRIYSRAVSPQEIALSAAGASPVTPLPKKLYSFGSAVVAASPRRRTPGPSYFWMTRR